MNLRFLFLILASCNSSEKNNEVISLWDDNLTVEQNIANNAIAFQTNNEFPFLDEIAKTKTVIALGEQGHNDMTSSKVKREMVNYLQKRGVDNLALEVAAFLTSYLFSHPDYSEVTKDWKIEDFWYPLWTRQETCKPLLEMINKRDIKIWGIDLYAGIYDIIAVRSILDKYSDNSPLSIDWDELSQLYKKILIFYQEKYPASDQDKLMRMIDSISNYTQYLLHEKGNINDLHAIMQWVRNMNTLFSYAKFNIENPDNSDKAPLVARNRDSQMAENVIWLTEHFPNEKFSIWCANFQATKDISQTTYPTDSLAYFIFQSMGEGIANKLGNKFYSLALTSLNSSIYEAGTFETEIFKYSNNTPFAFIDFEFLRFANGYRYKEFDCSAIGKKKGRWLYIFDGVYYIRDQELFNEKVSDTVK